MVESSLKHAKAESFGIFVPSQNRLLKLTDDISNRSITGIAKHLGYHPDQIHTFGGYDEAESKIIFVVLEVFSMNVIFALTENSVLHLSENEVNDFIKDFDYNFEYKSTMVEDTLLSGIENKSLKIGFLCRIFDIEHKLWEDQILFEKIGVHAFFVNGYLAAFRLVDEELGKWARYFKGLNPSGFSDYAEVAKLYWKDDYDKITYELNAQFEAWADSPKATNDEHIPLHTTRFGTINFVMLLVCHYGKHIDIEQFEVINHQGIKKYQKVRSR